MSVASSPAQNACTARRSSARIRPRTWAVRRRELIGQVGVLPKVHVNTEKHNRPHLLKSIPRGLASVLRGINPTGDTRCLSRIVGLPRYACFLASRFASSPDCRCYAFEIKLLINPLRRGVVSWKPLPILSETLIPYAGSILARAEARALGTKTKPPHMWFVGVFGRRGSWLKLEFWIARTLDIEPQGVYRPKVNLSPNQPLILSANLIVPKPQGAKLFDSN